MSFLTMVPMGKRLVGCGKDDRVVVLDTIGAVGKRLVTYLGLVTGVDVCSLIPSRTNRF